MGEARAKLVDVVARQRYVRHYAFYGLSIQLVKKPGNRALQAFQQRALRRVLAPVSQSHIGSPCGLDVRKVRNRLGLGC